MVSSTSFVDFVVDLLGPIGSIRAKKMFGEYGIYCNEVFFAMVCEDTLYLQIGPPIQSEFTELAPPYSGASLAGLISADLLEDHEELLRLARLSYEYKKSLPAKKKKIT